MIQRLSIKNSLIPHFLAKAKKCKKQKYWKYFKNLSTLKQILKLNPRMYDIWKIYYERGPMLKYALTFSKR